MAWVAPTLIGAQAAAAVTCRCYAFKVDSPSNGNACTAFTSVASTGGASCTGMNTAWQAAIGATPCPTFASSCSAAPGSYSGVTLNWTGGNQTVVVTFPAGATPLFMGVRYNNGCAWLSTSACTFASSSCTTVSKDISDTFTGTPLVWNRTNRQFTATTSGWTAGVNGISHVVFAWSGCGS